jgi:hypothetical protein
MTPGPSNRANVVARAVLQTAVGYFIEHWADGFSGAELETLVAAQLRDEFSDLARKIAADRGELP